MKAHALSKTLPKPVLASAVLMSVGLCGEVKLTARETKSGLHCCIWPEHFDHAKFFRCEAFIIIPIWQVEKLRQGRAKYQMCSLVWGCLVGTQPSDCSELILSSYPLGSELWVIRRLEIWSSGPWLQPAWFQAASWRSRARSMVTWVLTGSPRRAVHLRRQHRGELPPWQGSASWLVSKRHVRWTGPRKVKFVACKLWLELKSCCDLSKVSEGVSVKTKGILIPGFVLRASSGKISLKMLHLFEVQIFCHRFRQLTGWFLHRG